MSACINPIDNQIQIAVSQTPQGWSKIDSKLAMSLLNVPRYYIVIENNIPREMTNSEKATYNSAHPLPLPPRNPIQIFKALSDATNESDGQEMATAKLQAPFNMFSDMVLAGDYASAWAVAQAANSDGLISNDLLAKIKNVLQIS